MPKGLSTKYGSRMEYLQAIRAMRQWCSCIRGHRVQPPHQCIGTEPYAHEVNVDDRTRSDSTVVEHT